MMPTDTDVSEMSSLLPDIVDYHPIPIYQLKRKTATLINVMGEQMAEELVWVKLFPGGGNEFGEDRPLDYFQKRVLSNDRRFQTNECLLYALSTVESHKAQQTVSVCGRLRQNAVQPNNAVHYVHLVMCNIRRTIFLA